jgi:anti-sigma B factor antagonist
MLPRTDAPCTDTPRHSPSRASLMTIRQSHTRAVVRAVGEWDLANADILAEMFEAHQKAGRRFVRLDLSALTFLDCACVSVLVTAHRRLLAAGGTLVLTGVTRRVLRLLSLAGLDDVLLSTSLSELEIVDNRRIVPGHTAVVRPLTRR